jgi:hypothetical protein
MRRLSGFAIAAVRERAIARFAPDRRLAQPKRSEHGERRRGERRNSAAQSSTRASQASHCGTADATPRLQAGFVAQVIGQVLEPGTSSAEGGGYCKQQPRRGLLCDRRI